MARRVEKLGEGKNMLGRISNFFLHNNLFRYNYPRIPNETGANKKVRLITSLPIEENGKVSRELSSCAISMKLCHPEHFSRLFISLSKSGNGRVCKYVVLHSEAEKNEISRQT